MGTFTVTGEPFVTESNSITNQSKIDFVFDKKAETTPGLIEFIAASLNKNKNLVTADIESYLLETRQWINISKSYVLEGMGELVMDKNSMLQFRQMAPLSPKEEENRRRHPQVKETNYNTEPRRNKRSGVFAFATIIILLILGGGGWLVYNYIISKPKNNEIISNDQPAPVVPDSTPKKAPDTTTISTPKTDSSSHETTQQPVAGADSNHYKYIFEVTLNRDRAVSRTQQLNSFGNKAAFDSVPGGAFTRYRLYLDVTASSSDTLRIKDSLAKYLQRSILIKKY